MDLESLGFRFVTISEGVEAPILALADLRHPEMAPLFVDFLSGQMNHRRRHGLGKGQPLARALGLKSFRPEEAPFVLDATAGLGVDAFVMASMGCRVRSIERSPVVFELLNDGWKRLHAEAERLLREEEDEILLAISSRLSFECGDAKEILANLDANHQPDIVYLDPMYPEEGRSKSALPKKGMQVFRRLIGDDADAAEMFPFALRMARQRVVVKRPVHAPHLGGRPTHEFAGKTARYDMYIPPLR